MNISDVRKDLETGVDDVGTVAREVVAKRVAIVAVLTVLINLAVSYGWVTPDISGEVARWIEVVFDVAGAVAAIAVIRPAVTPVSDPKDSSGEKLVPVSSALAAVEKAVNEVTGAVKSKDVADAPNVLSDVVAAGKELVQDAKTDVGAVVAPVQQALNPAAPTPTADESAPQVAGTATAPVVIPPTPAQSQ